MSPVPRIVPRRLAEEGSLADAVADGRVDLFPVPVGREAAGGAGPTGRERPVLAPAGALTPTTPRAAEKLAAILDGRGVAVTTGQQPGLFLGPLYTIYKAVTAVRAAETVERRLGVPALAVFWTASDDHDWEEVAACRLLDPDEGVRTLRIAPPEGREDGSVGTTPLPAEVEDRLDELRSALGGGVPGTPPRWLDELAAAYRPGRTFGAAFVDALAAAFTGIDLAILDAGRPELRRAAAPFYRRVLDAPDAVTAAMAAGRRAVEAAGFPPALTPPPEGLQLFVDAGAGRRHVLRSGTGFDPADTRDLLASEPERFTPAAALRPVLESWLFPVAASVLGPGEIAYWAQLPPLFDALDVPVPAVVPRDAWILVEPRVDRLLHKLELTAGEVEREGAALDERWIRDGRPPGVEASLRRAGEAVDAALTAIDDAVGRELPGLRSAAGKLRHRLDGALGEFERTVDARVREEASVVLGQLARLRAHLAPGGEPQERAIGAVQALAAHGPPLISALLEASRVAAPGGQD